MGGCRCDVYEDSNDKTGIGYIMTWNIVLLKSRSKLTTQTRRTRELNIRESPSARLLSGVFVGTLHLRGLQPECCCRTKTLPEARREGVRAACISVSGDEDGEHKV